MQKSIKKTTKLYLTMIMIGILVVALSLSLYFTLGTRSSNGNKGGNSSGTVAQMSAQVVNNDGGAVNNSTKNYQTSKLITNVDASDGLYVMNTSNISAYVRAKVILTTGTTGGTTTDSNIYVTAGDGWTYAADNYLYYKDVVAVGAKTTAVFNSIINPNYSQSTNVNIQVVAEVIQEKAATPSVTVTGLTQSGTIDDNIPEQGLLNYVGNLPALTAENGNQTVTIENTGRLDLDVKVRIASSEWTISSATINGGAVKVERDANNGFFWVMGKLPAKQSCTLTFIDSFKNNGIIAGTQENANNSVTLILQDYVLANDYYSIVDANGQNIVSAFAGGTTQTIDTSSISLSGAKIYSYNNVPQYIYVQTITSNNTKVDYASGWSIIEGEQIAISSEVAPKSSTSAIYATAPTGTVSIKVWSAIPIQSATVSLVKGIADPTQTEDTPPYGQVSASGGTTVGSVDLAVAVSALSDVNNGISAKWGNLRVASNDYSDLIVRVAIGFEWGTVSGNAWVASTTQTPLAVDLTQYVGAGFAYNKEDSTLTYVYNLSNGNATPKLLDLTNAESLVSSIKSATKPEGATYIKLRVMIEAIYAEGSQFDVIYGGTKVGDADDNYYISLDGYTSMVETGEKITYTANSTTLDWNKYLVYVKNNFPLGVKVSLALQWGTLDGTTWTPDAKNPHSTINIYEYISSDWTFNADIGGAEYNYSVPGNAATQPLFDSTGLSQLKSAINNEASGRTTVRLVVIVGTTHLG